MAEAIEIISVGFRRFTPSPHDLSCNGLSRGQTTTREISLHTANRYLIRTGRDSSSGGGTRSKSTTYESCMLYISNVFVEKKNIDEKITLVYYFGTSTISKVQRLLVFFSIIIEFQCR